MTHALKLLIGKTLTRVSGMEPRSDKITLASESVTVALLHDQDCCEAVEVYDVIGDPEDLLDSPILTAEERSSKDQTDEHESATWTFYEFATIKGSVTIRWLGISNGYYSERVDAIVVERYGVKEGGYEVKEEE